MLVFTDMAPKSTINYVDQRKLFSKPAKCFHIDLCGSKIVFTLMEYYFRETSFTIEEVGRFLQQIEITQSHNYKNCFKQALFLFWRRWIFFYK